MNCSTYVTLGTGICATILSYQTSVRIWIENNSDLLIRWIPEINFQRSENEFFHTHMTQRGEFCADIFSLLRGDFSLKNIFLQTLDWHTHFLARDIKKKFNVIGYRIKTAHCNWQLKVSPSAKQVKNLLYQCINSNFNKHEVAHL